MDQCVTGMCYIAGPVSTHVLMYLNSRSTEPGNRFRLNDTCSVPGYRLRQMDFLFEIFKLAYTYINQVLGGRFLVGRW